MLQIFSRAFLRRQPRRSTAAYLLWLFVAYLPSATLCALANDEDRFLHPKCLLIWLLVIPVVIAVTQIIYPTLLGWLIIFVPTLVCVAAQFIHMGYYAATHQPLSFFDRQDLGEGIFFYGFMALTCAVLTFARPKRANISDMA